jgi:hypothetical protein
MLRRDPSLHVLWDDFVTLFSCFEYRIKLIKIYIHFIIHNTQDNIKIAYNFLIYTHVTDKKTNFFVYVTCFSTKKHFYSS